MTGSPVSCKELSSCGRVPTKVLHCAIVTKAAVLMFPLSLQSIISYQMRPRKLRFSRLLRHPARRRSGSMLSPGTHTGYPARGTISVTADLSTSVDSSIQRRRFSTRFSNAQVKCRRRFFFHCSWLQMVRQLLTESIISRKKQHLYHPYYRRLDLCWSLRPSSADLLKTDK